MMRVWTGSAALLCIAALVSVIVLAGCPKSETATSTPPVSAATAPAASNSAASGTTPGVGEEMASCPVLGTTMPKSQMIKVDHKGKSYYLCCQDCVPKFKADPEKYVKHPAKPLPAGQGMSH